MVIFQKKLFYKKTILFVDLNYEQTFEGKKKKRKNKKIE